MSINIFLFIVCLIFNVGSVLANPVLLIVGTRPEAIKMIPVYKALKEEQIPVCICSTGQHAQLLDDIFTLFQIKPDYELKIMKPGQDLFYITESVLTKTKELYEKIKPSLVVVQGDTTSAMVAALAAFYLKIPVAHVEAGLRTNKIYAPFPEEMNRRMISVIATLHFAPTALSKANLLDSGVDEASIFCTGNTVIDSLNEIKQKIKDKELNPSAEIIKTFSDFRSEKKDKIFILTAHRRESFNGGLKNIMLAVKESLQEHPELHIIYPMHPNPMIKDVVDEVELEKSRNIKVIPPLSYVDMVFALDNADGILTDSGGIQEEAVSLSKNVLVLRNETDRPEGLQEGLAILVGTNKTSIVSGINRIIKLNPKEIKEYPSPYGDGHASQRIAKEIKKFLKSR